MNDVVNIKACLSGNTEAFCVIIQRHQNAIANLLWRFTRDRNVLEDLIQETFIEAFVSLKTFRGDAPFLNWLKTIATRIGYRFWKNKQLDQRQQEMLEQIPLKIDTTDTLQPNEAADRLFHLLSRLAPEDRLVLTLHYFEECSMHDIANRLNWSYEQVKVRAHRARHKLREVLENTLSINGENHGPII